MFQKKKTKDPPHTHPRFQTFLKNAIEQQETQWDFRVFSKTNLFGLFARKKRQKDEKNTKWQFAAELLLFKVYKKNV